MSSTHETIMLSPHETIISSPHETNAVSINVDSLNLTDFRANDEGELVFFQGQPFSSLNAKQLRAIASKLKIKGLRNAKKADIVKAITTAVMNMNAYKVLDNQLGADLVSGGKEKTQKEVHCSFRLMNVLFSDGFVEDLAQLGHTANRELLDSGKASNDRYFWEKVQGDYVSDNESYGHLQFSETSSSQCKRVSSMPQKQSTMTGKS